MNVLSPTSTRVKAQERAATLLAFVLDDRARDASGTIDLSPGDHSWTLRSEVVQRLWLQIHLLDS